MKIETSTRADKRLSATFANGKVVHFGRRGGQTYIDHGDEAKKTAYLARHKSRENWDDPYSAGALSRWLLWGDSRLLDVNHESFMRRFRVS
jgi:hypothetical protein